ncbi:MAG: nuclear transport factor 2 family protein [Woeseiaceae bacterium]|nr:nuclear transport factor 2 family protein [Woeseiaceae bacterium]
MSDKMKIINAIRDASLSKNHEAYLSHLTDDIEYHYHMSSRPLIGKEWVQKFLTKYESIAKDVVWRIDRHAETGNAMLLEGYEEYTDMRTGDRIAHPYMGVFEFEGDKVCKRREYFEMDQKTDSAA